MSYSGRISIDRELVLDFFLVLSRMEFALKLSGFAKGDDKGVSPDWDDFAKSIKESFDKDVDENILEAVTYYLESHPYKQILRDNNLEWASAFPTVGTEIEQVLILIRRVRNNLFHGAKFYPVDNPDNDRNEKLLTFGMIILKEAMRMSPSVETTYNDAKI